jgi:hypothetical protein
VNALRNNLQDAVERLLAAGAPIDAAQTFLARALRMMPQVPSALRNYYQEIQLRLALPAMVGPVLQQPDQFGHVLPRDLHRYIARLLITHK